MLLGSTFAASLDTVEVGGPHGTPTSTDATAIWWNPSGLAVGSTTSFSLEVAPMWGSLTVDRDEPNGGSQTWSGASAVPFMGVAHSPRRGPSLGLALAIPYARGGLEDARGVGSFSLRESTVAAAYLSGAIAWDPHPNISVGGALSGVGGIWSSTVDMDTVPDLHQSLLEMGETSPYTDADLEDPQYAATAQFQELTATALTGAVGVNVGNDLVTLGVAYHHGATLDHRGKAEIQFGCPPADDEIGRFGAESKGVCHTRVVADARAVYHLPSRVHIGLAITPREGLRLEAMGGWVGWAAHDSFDITLSNIAENNPGVDAKTAESIEGDRPKAVNGQNAVFGGVDVKLEPRPAWTVGGRLLYDQASVPDHMLSPSNADFDSLRVTAMTGVQIRPGIELAASLTQVVSAPRSTDSSALWVTLDTNAKADEGYQYPHGNGTYKSSMSRAGINLRVSR
ncbi:MAG TPA: hypothetical protein QGF58_24990 [Myxococcota bacterium]|nr:hypothetical protein [Myxococcota bacterium]